MSVAGGRVSDFFNVDLFLKFAIALAALLNPLLGVPVFLKMTNGYPPAEKRKVAHVVGVTIFVACIVILLIGEEILAFFGISIPGFQITGGVVIFGLGLSLIQSDDSEPASDQAAPAEDRPRRNIAVVPMAIPIMLGPGAITTIIVFTQLMNDTSELVTMVPVVLLISVMVWLGLLFADVISRTLGDTVINIVTRIMGLILAAVAVEMLVAGVVAFAKLHFPALVAGG
nr:MarC family protein [Flavimaribacter sediminis]